MPIIVSGTKMWMKEKFPPLICRMKIALTAADAIRRTNTIPIVRCGRFPFGANIWIDPISSAPTALRICSWTTKGAVRKASVFMVISSVVIGR